MFEISAGGGTPTSGKSAFSGKSGKIPVPSKSILDRVKDALLPAKDTLKDKLSAKPVYYSRGDDGSSSHSSGLTTVAAPSAAALDYLNADLAKHYGMDEVTAYNEALSNTAYQRAVKDMQAAGLNPAVLFGHGRVDGADGVYGAELLQPVETSASGAYHSSGHSGSSGSRSRSRAGRPGKLFSSDSYAMISGLGALAGAGIAVATGGSAGLGALTGSSVATSAAKVLNGLWKKR